jgi:hypothetical protein
MRVSIFLLESEGILMKNIFKFYGFLSADTHVKNSRGSFGRVFAKKRISGQPSTALLKFNKQLIMFC